MLAVHPPRAMGSTQPSDVNLPFGYTYDSDHLFLDPPPEPAPGQPLLSDNESKLLSSFFEDMTADNYSTTSFGEGLNFSDDWLNLPPQFMGHTTSYGQQSALPLESQFHGLPEMFHDLMPPPPTSASMMHPPPPPPPPPVQPQQQQQQPQQAHPPVPIEQQHLSADVLAAATLLQNGSLGRTTGNVHDRMFTTSDTRPPMGPPVGHLRHQPLAEFRQAERRMSQPHMVHEHDNTFTDMMFGSGSGQRPMTAPRAAQVDVQWGSDSNFARRSFVPTSEKETSEALLNERLAYMECLEVSSSAATTRAPSPSHLHNGHSTQNGHTGRGSNGDSSPLKLKTRDPLLAVKQEQGEDGPSRKRRKSKAKDEDVDEEEELQSTTTSKAPARKRKTKSDAPTGISPVSSETPGKRRKSAASSAAKQPRENLSEEQKRENHIKSEQKRRTVIKEGFDDLCDLVPGLKGGGFSKSTMLAMAGEWLEEILKGNEQLAAQLAKLQDGQ